MQYNANQHHANIIYYLREQTRRVQRIELKCQCFEITLYIFWRYIKDDTVDQTDILFFYLPMIDGVKIPLGNIFSSCLTRHRELLDNTIFLSLILSCYAKLFILKNCTFFPINLCIQSMFFLSSSFRIFICLQLDWNQIIALNRIIWWLILLLL